MAERVSLLMVSAIGGDSWKIDGQLDGAILE